MVYSRMVLKYQVKLTINNQNPVVLYFLSTEIADKVIEMCNVSKQLDIGKRMSYTSFDFKNEADRAWFILSIK